MIQDSFFLAFKNLKHRGIRSWLTLIGIFIGITAVVSLISLGNGLQVAVASQFGISQTQLITIQASGISGAGPPGTGVIVPLNIKDLDAIEKLSSVKRAIRRNIISAKFEYNDNLKFGMATNTPVGQDRDFFYETLGAKSESGRLLKDGDTKKVLLGYNFYVDKAGFDKKIIPGKKILINDVEFEVVGITKKKGSFIFDNIAYINQDDADNLFNYGDNIDLIVAQPTDPKEMQKTKEDIEKLLRKRRDVKVGEENFEISTPDNMLDTVNGILGGVQAFIVIIASISIFIGALGIVNTMTTSVLERKREIGIMKSIGARNNDIFMQFFIESSLLGLVGGIIGAIFGTLIGILGTSGINSFIGTDLSPSINFPLIFFALLGSFVIGGLAGIVPALNAAKENPVDALRG